MYPVLLDFGFYQLRSYGVFVAVAIVTGIWFSIREARRKGLDPSVVADAVWVIVGAGLVGARLYYIAFSQPRQGSRVIGEERFQAALAHQRATYLKSRARGEESFTIYDPYPAAREVIRY